jgi:subtilisin family serine protease
LGHAGGTGARDSHPAHNTVLMKLRRALDGRTVPLLSVQQPAFRQTLARALDADQCELSWSGLAADSTELVLTLYCDHLNNTKYGAKSRRAALPKLDETRRLLMAQYRYEVTHLEYLSQTKHSYWYGNYDSLDSTLKVYFANREHDAATRRAEAQRRMQRAKFTEASAPWGLDRIDQHYGLLDGQYQYSQLGTQVDWYGMDTGIRVTHQEFEGRAVFLSNTVGDGINTDCAGHGTLTASLAGGRTYGSAKGVNVWAVKVLDCTGNGDTFTIVTGAMAVNEHVAQRRLLGYRAVASMSLGGDASTAIDDAVRSLLANNVTVVVAAGNEHGDACDYSPSRLGQSTTVVTVGASTITDTRPYFSNVGRCVKLSAPGVDITGAWHTSDSALQTADGTSMSTPFVSGAAALVLDQNTDLTVAQVTALLHAWATPAVVTGATYGGHDLLYTRIVWDATPDVVQSPTPHPPVPPGIDSAAAPRGIALWLFLIVFFLLTCA